MPLYINFRCIPEANTSIGPLLKEIVTELGQHKLGACVTVTDFSGRAHSVHNKEASTPSRAIYYRRGSCELLVTNIETTEGYLSPPRGICMEHQDSPPPYSSKIVGYSTVYFAQNFLGCNEEIQYNEETQFLVLQWL